MTERSGSELVREAVSESLAQNRRMRIVEEIRQAAKALYSDPEAVRKRTRTAEEGVKDWLESIEREQRAAGIDPGEKWWG